MRKKVHILMLSVLFMTYVVHGQIESGTGKGPGRKVPDRWTDATPPASALNTLRNIIPGKNEPLRFALPIPVALNPQNSGTIEERDGEKVWTVGITSKGALSLNLILTDFKLPEGGYFYLYNGDMSVIRGAFTEDNNNSSGVLPLMPLPGDAIVLELHVPERCDISGVLTISQVSHDYRGVFALLEAKDGFYNTSQPCNSDLACYPAGTYDNQKNSVARIIIRGVELCSGALINNGNQENIPYFLTAEHCISNASEATQTVFVFNYESPWCKGPDGRVFHSVSGSTIKAINPDIDFTLIQLNQFPPITYKPYLAGWDRSEVQALNTYSIHHPQGDVKKVAIDNNQPVTSTYPGYSAGSFWKILQWEVGTTEPGSSGGPLFNQSGRIIGSLTGGEANCSLSINDYYAKVARMFSASTLPGSGLASWLDPGQTGVLALDGRDPYAPNHATNDTLVNMPLETYGINSYSLPGSGYSTGFNSDSVLLYAEYFNNARTAFITEISIGVGVSNYVSIADSITLYVFADGPVPGSLLASRKFLISETGPTTRFIADFGTAVPVTGNFYVGWRLWYNTKAVSETRQMAVKKTGDLGGTEFNTAWLFHSGVWKPFYQHPSLPASASLDVKVVTTTSSVVYSISDPPLIYEKIHIYPNPASEIINIVIAGASGPYPVEIFNESGMLVSSFYPALFQDEVIGLDISGLSTGPYIIRYRTQDRLYSGKFIKIKK